jgi:hypothetical protein
MLKILELIISQITFVQAQIIIIILSLILGMCAGKALLFLCTESGGSSNCRKFIASLTGFEIGALRINIMCSA